MENTNGKLLEKIVTRIVAYELGRHHILPATLGSYKWNTETWCNAAVFAYDVYEGFHAGTETCTSVIDLEDVCSRVSFYFLLYQLLKLSIHPVLVNWILMVINQRKAV